MLNRRNFMKMLGAITAMPSALLKGKPTFASHPADILLDLGMPEGKAVDDVRALCDEKMPDINDGDWHTLLAVTNGTPNTQLLFQHTKYKNGVLVVDSGHKVFIDGVPSGGVVFDDNYEVSYEDMVCWNPNPYVMATEFRFRRETGGA